MFKSNLWSSFTKTLNKKVAGNENLEKITVYHFSPDQVVRYLDVERVHELWYSNINSTPKSDDLKGQR